jgi:hypothetical protein
MSVTNTLDKEIENAWHELFRDWFGYWDEEDFGNWQTDYESAYSWFRRGYLAAKGHKYD